MGLSLEMQMLCVCVWGGRLEDQRTPGTLCPSGRGCWPHAGPQEAEVRGWAIQGRGASLSEPANPSETSLPRRHQRPSRPEAQALSPVEKTPGGLCRGRKRPGRHVPCPLGAHRLAGGTDHVCVAAAAGRGSPAAMCPPGQINTYIVTTDGGGDVEERSSCCWAGRIMACPSEEVSLEVDFGRKEE